MIGQIAPTAPRPQTRSAVVEIWLLVDPATGPEVRSVRSPTGSRDCSTRWGRLVGREVAGWVRGRAGCGRGRGVVQGWGRAR